MKILVTGTAGFIGYFLVKKLITLGHDVTGIDKINDYYDIKLKYDRLLNSGIIQEEIQYGKKIKSSSLSGYNFIKLDITDLQSVNALFKEEQFDCICHLAAQAGVRYSLENPQAYIDSNITGFLNILEACKIYTIKHIVFASSSSVYGLNDKVPFSVDDPVNQPISLYAAYKRSNELMAYTYSHLFAIPFTGLRFFTVYGPWGRPDMAYYKFANAIFQNKPIEIYNHGNMLRDFTYIDDIIDGIIAAINNVPVKNDNSPPLVIYNLGNNNPVKLMYFIECLEKALDRKSEKLYLDMQSGDVPVTFADINETKLKLGWEPKTSLDRGLKLFVEWFYKYNINESINNNN